MKFGSIDHPDTIDFTLPADNENTLQVLQSNAKDKTVSVYVGCAKWNRQDLKGFYPRGTKDELTYYSTQFNCIEMNATFYRIPSVTQIITWRNKTPQGFKFFPKITETISHRKRLNDVDSFVDEFCMSVANFKDKLGMVFLQMHNNFRYKNFDRLKAFVESFPKEIPLAVELRNTEWFNDESISTELYDLFEKNNVTNIIADTAGRRDLLHMRLTTPSAFIRYVGANHQSDYTRMDDWLERIKTWIDNGLTNLYFFVHQNIEVESPLLAAYFIKKLNNELGFDLKIPNTQSGNNDSLLKINF